MRRTAVSLGIVALMGSLLGPRDGRSSEPSLAVGAARAGGRLFLIGGREDKRRDLTVLRAFVRFLGGPRARLLVLTYPSRDQDGLEAAYREAFGKLGVEHLRFLRIADRADADRTEAADEVQQTDGVYFTGGSQWKIVGLIKGTRLEDALLRRWDQGLRIAGTSAGAAMTPETMLTHGSSNSAPRAGDPELEPGMGLIRGVVVDSHFAQRGRHGRLMAAVSERPDLLGLGIDEDTALALDGDRFEVLGDGCVTVLDAGKSQLNNRPGRGTGAPVALSGVTLHSLPAGYGFDLRTRSAFVVPTNAGR